MPNPKKKMQILALIGLLMILVLILGIYFLLTGTIDITKLPESAKLLINGKEYESTPNFHKRLFVGEYLVQISADDYTPFSQKIKITPASHYQIKEPIIPFISSKVLANSVTALSKQTDDREEYYYVSGSVLYATKKDFNPIAKTANSFSGVTKIRWSPDKKLAIIFRPNSTELFDFQRYDLISQTIKSWESEIKDALWLDQDNIVLYFERGEEKSLILTNAQRTKNEIIADLRPYVSNGATILLVPASSNEVFIVGKDLIKANLSTKQITPITNSGNLLSGKVSPDEKYLFINSQQGGVFYNIATNELINVEINSPVQGYDWLGEKLYLANDGKLGMVEPTLPKPLFFNEKPQEIIQNINDLIMIDKTVAFISANSLYNVNIKL